MIVATLHGNRPHRLGVTLAFCALALMYMLGVGVAATYMAGNQQYSQAQMQQAFSNSSNSYISSNSGYFAGMSTFESGGNTGITNGTTYGTMQMTSQNIYNTTGMSPSQFSQQSAQFQTNAYSTYFGNVMNEAPEQQLLQMQANGQTVGGQPITTGMIVGCAQLGSPHCQAQINSGCGTGAGQGADSNGTTLCKFANQADANAAKGGYTGNGTSNSMTNTSSNSAGPSNPARSNPCTCPGNRQGTDAELMKDSCPTNTSTVQNWPNTNTGYLGSPPPKVTVGTNICDPSAPSRVPDNFSPSTGSNNSNTSNTSNASNTSNTSDTSNSSNSSNQTTGAPINQDKLNQDVNNGQCLSNSHGPCQCVTLVRDVSGLPPTSSWTPGQQVIGGNIAPGTPIATFGSDGTYLNQSGQSHAAIFESYNSDGSINVIDQYGSGATMKPPGPSTFAANNVNHPAESAGQFYVINTK